MSAVLAAGTNGATGVFMAFSAATTVVGGITDITHGWREVEIKRADLAAAIPAGIQIPPIVGSK